MRVLGLSRRLRFTVLLTALAVFAIAQTESEAQASAYKEKVIYSFCRNQDCADGATPAASLVYVNGMLYGTTLDGGGTGCGGGGCGTVFSIDLNTGTETVLHSFLGEADGAFPQASLTVLNGFLYGTTRRGGGSGCGGNGCGTVYSIDSNTGSENVLYSFCIQQNCADGADPWASLSLLKGKLYGTTLSGGNLVDGASYGTLFVIDPGTSAQSVVYSFCHDDQCSDGAQPVSSLINVKGTLYGTTPVGGAGEGTVFSFDPKTGIQKVLYSFGSVRPKDGVYPFAGLLKVKGTLYGTTQEGGNNSCQGFGCGTVFAIDAKTGDGGVLYSFGSQPDDGLYPQAGLLHVKGKLYGTTPSGGLPDCGSNGCGTVFAIDPDAATETILYSFCRKQGCKDGATPSAGLIAVNGKFYGTTSAGGNYNKGTVFVLEKQHH